MLLLMHQHPKVVVSKTTLEEQLLIGMYAMAMIRQNPLGTASLSKNTNVQSKKSVFPLGLRQPPGGKPSSPNQGTNDQTPNIMKPPKTRC